ncbi:MAG TPA: TetR/AcrR family transcriptional regulator, partial [Thermoanaerobaculia bacterium]|nr:TetR/AcrR family transcriptional regulator [Thermoanaerobaculia bacterium]
RRMQREEKSERSRRLVLDTALGLFCHQGYRATSVREIAKDAGVSVGNVYHHFPTVLIKSRTVVFFIALFSSSAVMGAITVTPASPSSTDIVTIRVQNTFGAEARATSTSITQVGNTFVIEQNVEIACMLPSNPVVASQFEIGPLAPGAYDVTANIIFTGIPPLPCSPPPITQTTAFTVAPSAVIPALSVSGLLLLGAALAVTAVAVLSRQ